MKSKILPLTYQLGIKVERSNESLATHQLVLGSERVKMIFRCSAMPRQRRDVKVLKNEILCNRVSEICKTFVKLCKEIK